MVQSLLADRFKLVVHTETRQLPVFGLALVKPVKPGPDLRRHSDDLPCAVDSPNRPSSVASTASANDALPFCGLLTGGLVSGHMRASTRSMSMDQIALNLIDLGNLDRPVLDQTGLLGSFDFTIEWIPDVPIKVNGENVQLDESEPTFLEALKDQLGLKLDSQTGPVDVIVLDHVEEPSEN